MSFPLALCLHTGEPGPAQFSFALVHYQACLKPAEGDEDRFLLALGRKFLPEAGRVPEMHAAFTCLGTCGVA